MKHSCFRTLVGKMDLLGVGLLFTSNLGASCWLFITIYETDLKPCRHQFPNQSVSRFWHLNPFPPWIPVVHTMLGDTTLLGFVLAFNERMITMLCWFSLYSKVNQLYVCICCLPPNLPSRWLGLPHVLAAAISKIQLFTVSMSKTDFFLYCLAYSLLFFFTSLF